MEQIIAILIMIVLIIGFIILWKVNHDTPIPEGAFDSMPECSGCANKSCSNYKKSN